MSCHAGFSYKIRVALGPGKLNSDRLEVPSVPRAVDHIPIKRRIAAQLQTRSTSAWLAALEPHDIWCSEVLTWPELFGTENFRLLDMVQTLRKGDGFSIRTLRSPIRVDGQRGRSERPAPEIGENTEALRREFELS